MPTFALRPEPRQQPPVNVCPVCGWPGLAEPAVTNGIGSGEICNSCGYEFDGGGANDPSAYQSARDQWVSGGMKWFGQVAGVSQPKGWNPKSQLDKLNNQSNAA